ncbi:LLM class flavin-dependent oxidoreductase [Allonocardiopsis opalescens]|uniref:Hemerythrin HHE cation binding domain-containing protein n=1 Tax=Allonocardiopsis opalescens TaxID=1144618 RepID=A0A2T0Q4D4_9ACTN|nr:LLM class flavin-dependent oxidoreductase [Allonocardiopsis opalescens]PRX98666.1 hemerythrin HHE cation binding domain-containing protein [Allonocardiopsis opalescens]
MTDHGHPLLFGAFVAPDARQPKRTVELARFADAAGLDILGVQDHPYQPNFLDTWTLLSTLAGQTERIVLFPDVVNLPLRPPAVLARAAASLDVLSGGRVELGLGAGAFPDGVAAMGGPARGPGESIEALEEAIGVIRSLWTPGEPVRMHGRHYTLDGARPGPVPAHPVGIWVGSYKRRMLRLTGRLADGWIPSSMYAAPEVLPGMAAIIDAAAEEAGRDPADIRRWYNVAGGFTGRSGGFLQGPPALWVEQLAELALEQGVSGFILGPGAAAESDLRRFAEEVAPAVRAAVAAERGTPVEPADVQADLAPAERTAGHPPVLDPATRPRAPRRADAPASAAGRANAQHLVQIHDHLRSELEQIRGVVEQLAAGHADPASARSLINRMTMRQNYWSVGAFCASYCRMLTLHHTIEDEQMFTGLRVRDAELGPVLDRLSEEHEVIADILVRLDAALVGMVADPDSLDTVRRETETLAEQLLSHLDYEEEELLEPIARLGLRI